MMYVILKCPTKPGRSGPLHLASVTLQEGLKGESTNLPQDDMLVRLLQQNKMADDAILLHPSC